MAASSLLPKPVERAVSERVARGDYPALIIAAVDGQQSQIAPFGQLGNGQRLDEDTEFEVGSVTKTLTALMLAQLVRSGSVQLDEPVGTLLDGWQFPSHGGKVITLEELATQRSGLPRLPDNFAPTDHRNPYADYGPRQLKAFLSHYELTRAPGAQYEYSNVGFGLLGYALAIWHNGMTGGYASFIGFTSDRKRGVVVLTNISKDVTDIGLAWLAPAVQNTMLRH